MVNIEKIKSDSEAIKKDVRKRTMDFLIAAFGFVAGLAWNEAIKAIIEQFIPLSKNTAIAKLIYAMVVTILLAVISYYLLRSAKTKEAK